MSSSAARSEAESESEAEAECDVAAVSAKVRVTAHCCPEKCVKVTLKGPPRSDGKPFDLAHLPDDRCSKGASVCKWRQALRAKIRAVHADYEFKRDLAPGGTPTPHI